MSGQPRKRLEVEELGDIAVVNFLDKKIMDEQNIQLIGEQLFALVDNDKKKKIVLDFSNVDYLSSAALGKIIALNNKVKKEGGKLVLCKIKEDIKEVFTITRLDKLIKIVDDQQAALQAAS